MITSRYRAFCLASLLLTTSCNSRSEELVSACDSSPKFQPSQQAAQSISEMAAITVEQTQSLRADVAASTYSSGFWASLRSKMWGSEAANLSTRIELLRLQVANVKAFEFSWLNGGSSPLPRGSANACRMLADSVASFSIANSREHVLISLWTIENHFSLTRDIFAARARSKS